MSTELVISMWSTLDSGGKFAPSLRNASFKRRCSLSSKEQKPAAPRMPAKPERAPSRGAFPFSRDRNFHTRI